MNRSVFIVLLMLLQTASGAVPRLFQEKEFTSASFAEAVNHFIALGEQGAVEELDGLALDSGADFTNHGSGAWSVNERIGWMCRVLFEPRAGEPLRPPLFGALFIPEETMPSNSWPLYPVALSRSTYFVLSEGYMRGGRGENPKDYVEFCRQNGNFRKQAVAVPTRKQAIAAAAALRGSSAWKAIKWTDSGVNWSYDMDEPWSWKFIQNQAENIP